MMLRTKGQRYPLVRKGRCTHITVTHRQASAFTEVTRKCTVNLCLSIRHEWVLISSSLDAYYLLIHPSLPILPPPSIVVPSQQRTQAADEGDRYCSDSPLLHAVAALVALIPKGSDQNYTAVHARAARHEYAEHCSKLALRCIDSDMDTSGQLTRSRFHQDVPVYLESTIANLLIAMYEYNYRGVMMRARTRTASVISMAIDLGLHDAGSGSPLDSECKQRAWSMIVGWPVMLYRYIG